MVVDYEAAWIALQAEVAAKTQHGREGLLATMAELVAEHRVAAGELPRMFRLYGVEVAQAARRDHDRDEMPTSQRDAVPLRTAGSPATMTRGGHDGDDSDEGRRHAAG